MTAPVSCSAASVEATHVAVVSVRRSVQPLRLLDEAFRKVDSGESVHSAFDRVGLHTLHSFQLSFEQVGLGLELGEQAADLAGIVVHSLLVAFVEVWWPDLQVHHDLADRIRSHVNRLLFLHNPDHLRIDVMHLSIASSNAAFSEETFRTRVERDQLYGVSHVGRKLSQNLSEGNELLLFGIDVFLIDLIGKYYEAFLMCEFE
jgi:hypothetical protein